MELRENEKLRGRRHWKPENLSKLSKSNGVFHQPQGFKNTILREAGGRAGEWSRPEQTTNAFYSHITGKNGHRIEWEDCAI